MNKQLVIASICTLTSSLAEARDYQAPAGILYAAMSGSVTLEEFQTVILLMSKTGLVTESNHMLTLTPAGVKMGNDVNEILKEKGATTAE